MGVTTGRWRRGEELRGWGRRREVGALWWWGRKVATGLLHLAHFGLECQGQVGQVELAWFGWSRRSGRGVLRRGSSGGGGGTGGGRGGAALGSKLAEQVPPGFLIGSRGVELDAGVPLRGGGRFLASEVEGARGRPPYGGAQVSRREGRRRWSRACDRGWGRRRRRRRRGREASVAVWRRRRELRRLNLLATSRLPFWFGLDCRWGEGGFGALCVTGPWKLTR